ncbi:axin-related protein-like [Planococcus citri]|uniref:axin-related protein-like n=1 Tax=Planococcus citri TaxID=170843 RepID=UPI0031FA1FB4
MTSVTPTSDSASPTTPDVDCPGIRPSAPATATSPVPLLGTSRSSSIVPGTQEYADCGSGEGSSGAPLGYEPEGQDAFASYTDHRDYQRQPQSYSHPHSYSQSQSQRVSKNCLKWAESLHALLNDAEGLNLFQRFLQQEDPDRFQMLEFWLACKGLSKQPPVQAHQLVRVIYAQLFLKAQLGIDEHLRKSITQQIKNDTNNKKLLSPTIFNEACAVVERAMNEIMHPNFLASDIYLNYVQKLQNEMCDIGLARSCRGSQNLQREAPAILPEEQDYDNDFDDPVRIPATSQQMSLPILHEDKELTFSSSGGGVPSLRRRSAKPMSFSSSSSSCSLSSSSSSLLPMDSLPTKFLRQFGSVSRSNPSRRLYNYSYNPVSRQDSELQSLSSDARTDSMSDLSLDEKASTKETYAHKRQLQRQLRSMRENANLNKNSDLVFNLVPRTSNPHARECAKPLPPEEFARNLIFKLEKLKKERDAEEIVVRKLNTVEDLQKEGAVGIGSSSQNVLPEAMLFQRYDDESQEILDNHFARVWSDKTPRRSPSQVATPIRPKSPPKGWPTHMPAAATTVPTSVPLQARLPHSYVTNTAKRKDKDVCSLFSSDSGNGTDPAEGVEHRHRGGGGGCGSSSGGSCANLVKSKSMPEQNEPYNMEYLPGYYPRGAAGKTWSSSRRTLTDSGVSVISAGRGENIPPQSPQYKEKLVSSWLLDSNNRICASQAAGAASAPLVSGSGATCSVIGEEAKHKSRSSMAGYAPHGWSSRSKMGSCMSDRGNGNGGAGVSGSSASSTGVRNVLPGQPFVADPSMPPFPFHSVDTDTQLEETRRRLNEMGSKLNRLPVAGAAEAPLQPPSTTMTATTPTTSAATAAGGSKTCEYLGGGTSYPQTSCKTETSVTHRPSTLQRPNRKTFGSGGIAGGGEETAFTTVVYNFSDEQMPYLSRIPGNPITLKQFKDYMPKKGRYRYYFVTPCEDLEMQPIQEEITDDCDFLPLWKGKVIAQIRAID